MVTFVLSIHINSSAPTACWGLSINDNSIKTPEYTSSRYIERLEYITLIKYYRFLNCRWLLFCCLFVVVVVFVRCLIFRTGCDIDLNDAPSVRNSFDVSLFRFFSAFYRILSYPNTIIFLRMLYNLPSFCLPFHQPKWTDPTVAYFCRLCVWVFF